MTRAASSRAELRALQRSAERAVLESDAARRARLPAPTLFGGLETGGRRVWPRTRWGLRAQRIRAALRFGRARGREMGCRASRVSMPNARPSNCRFAARSFAPPRCWRCGRQPSRRTRNRPATNSCALPRSRTAKARSASSNCSTPFAPHHGRELAASTCGLTRAWHRSPWNAPWETSCGLEANLRGCRGRFPGSCVRPVRATCRRKPMNRRC